MDLSHKYRNQKYKPSRRKPEKRLATLDRERFLRQDTKNKP